MITSTRVLRYLAAALVLLAATCFFAWRSGLKAGMPLADFHSFYAAADALTHAHNPYDHPVLIQRWTQLAPSLGSIEQVTAIAAPTTILLVSPLTLLPPPAADIVWATAGILTVIATIWLVIQLAGLRLRQPAALLVAAAALMLAPFHIGLQMGQCSTFAIFFLILGTWALAGRRDWLAGVAIGVATAWKPQIGGIALLYCLLAGQRRSFILALLVAGLVAAVAAAWMTLADPAWLHTWKTNVQLSMQGSALNSLEPANHTRDHMLNLQIFTYSLTRSSASAGLVAFAIAAAAFLAFLLLRRRIPPADRDIRLELPALLCIGFLPVYHRYYDAAFLVLLFAWLAAYWQSKRLTVPVTLLLLPFLLPVGWPTNLLRKGFLPPGAAGTWWWDNLLIPLPALCLLLLTLGLLYAIAGLSREPASPSRAYLQDDNA